MNKVNKKRLTMSQAETVIWALYLLGGDQRRVDTEDVAVRAHELAPGRFAWRKHPHQINLELVRVFLSDAKKADKGALVTGSGRTGWSLTSKGVKWAAGVKKERVALLDRSAALSRAGSVDTNRRKQERDRLHRTAAWVRWTNGETTLSESESREILRIDSYSDVSSQQTKLARLRGLFTEDQELTGFLEAAAAALHLE